MRAVFASFLWLLAWSTPQAHSWYPSYCCHDRDCQQVDRFVALESGAYEVWAGSLHLIIPASYVIDSLDEHAHICTTSSPSGDLELLCFFAPHPAM